MEEDGVGKHENSGRGEAAGTEELFYQALGVLARPLVDGVCCARKIGLEVDLPHSGLKLAREGADECGEHREVLGERLLRQDDLASRYEDPQLRTHLLYAKEWLGLL